MRVLIDTNILISAALCPNGQAAKAYFKATSLPYECVICDYCVDEFRRVVRSRLYKYITNADTFLTTALMSAEIISTPTDDTGCEIKMAVRDVKDRPILCAAINARVDFILTGDKDFLESGIKNPRMITATEFLEL